MTKISDLTSLTGAGVDTVADLLPIVDASVAGAGGNKKITIAELRTALSVPSAYTDEQVRDVIATALTAGANITITPDDPGDTITIAATVGGAIEVLDEGVSETATLVSLNFTGTGVTATDDGSGNVQVDIAGAAGYTDEQARDAIGAALAGSGGITVTVNDPGDTITIGANRYEAGPPTPPTTADLATWDNQGTSTVSDGTGAMILKPQVDGVIHGRYKAAPATPYDIYCRVEQQCLSTAAITTNVILFAGLLFKDTGGDNERLSVGIYYERVSGDEQNLYAAVVQRWTGASPPVGGGTPIIKYTGAPWKWIRVNNDGTTLTFYVSPDGKNWLTVGTETLAAYIDGAASYGVCAYATSNATEAAALFSYFSTTAPA